MSDSGEYKHLTPHWSEFEEVSTEIRKVIGGFVSNFNLDEMNLIDEAVAKIIHRTVVKELDRFHVTADNIEADLKRWWNQPPPPSPPYKELLKRYIRHVSELEGTPLITSVKPSAEEFTAKERGILLALEAEAIEDLRRSKQR